MVLSHESLATDWRTMRERLITERDAKIPDSLRLPVSLLNNLPQDVTRIPRECGLLSAEEVSLSEGLDAVSARDLIAQGRLTSTAVVSAFAKRAVIAHQLVSISLFRLRLIFNVSASVLFIDKLFDGLLYRRSSCSRKGTR